MSSKTLYGCESGVEGDVVVLGLPFDHGSTHLEGSSAAPDVLRHLTCSARLDRETIYELASRTTIVEDLRVTDLGNLHYKASQRRTHYYSQVSRAAEVLVRHGKRPLFLGGDHVLTAQTVRGVAAGPLPDIQLIHLDAHHDYSPDCRDSQWTHATFVNPLASSSSVDRILQVGVRGVSTDLPDLPDKVRPTELDELAPALSPDLPVYLTVDTDAFDPSVAPAVNHPVPGGLPWSAVRKVVQQIAKAGCRLVAADWMEYNPRMERLNRITGRSIAWALAHLLQGMGASP